MIRGFLYLYFSLLSLPVHADSWTVLAEDGTRISFDSTQLVQVDYVMAGQGDGLASQFGHSLLRFEFCSERAPCEKSDRVAYDIGFAAETSRGYFSAMGGVTGRYPSILSVNLSVHSERKYLYEDLREMTVAPLNLTVTEREALLSQTVGLFWSTLDQYKFFSNNCAVQVLHLLERAVPDQRLLRIHDAFLTPKGVLHALLSDGRVQQNEIERFVSKREDMTHFAQALSLDRGTTQIGDLNQYAKVPARNRARWILLKPNSLSQRMQWLLLEEMVLRKQQAKFSKRALRYLFHQKGSLACGEDRVKLISRLESSYYNLKVTRQNANVDHVPIRRRYVDSLREALACLRQEPKFSTEVSELNGTLKNLGMLRNLAL